MHNYDQDLGRQVVSKRRVEPIVEPTGLRIRVNRVFRSGRDGCCSALLILRGWNAHLEVTPVIGRNAKRFRPAVHMESEIEARYEVLKSVQLVFSHPSRPFQRGSRQRLGSDDGSALTNTSLGPAVRLDGTGFGLEIQSYGTD